MRSSFAALLVAGLSLASTGCPPLHRQALPPPPPPVTPDRATQAAAYRAFATKLLREQRAKPGEVVIAPLPTWLSLSLTVPSQELLGMRDQRVVDAASLHVFADHLPTAMYVSNRWYSLSISPPLDMLEKWFAPHVAYSMAKYGMSMCVLGMAGEFREQGIAVNALWPRTTIATAAVNMLGGDELMRMSRKPDIMADAAHAIVSRPSREFTGNFCVDDEVLEAEGVTDLSVYSVDPSVQPAPDFFVEPRAS